MQINERTVLQIAAVYGSVRLISEAIAAMPVLQWRQMGTTEPKRMELAPVIAQPYVGDLVTQRDFVIQGTMSMLLQGTLWGEIISRDERLNPAQVKLVHPDHARIRRRQDNGQLEVTYWNQICPLDNVTRAMALSVPEGIKGLSPIEYLRTAFGIARAQDMFQSAFMRNSARPDGWISVDDDLDPDEVDRMMYGWNAAHQGIGKAGSPAVLTGGMKWNQISMSMADAQFLQATQLSASVISGQIYGIPPHMLGMTDKDTSWGSGIEQQQIGFVRDTLMIWLCRWEDMLSSWLPRGQFVTFDLSQRLRGDTLQRWAAWQLARSMGAMNNAEIRVTEGLPKVTDPEQAAILEAYDAPLNSSPMKPATTGGAGGDKAN
jgi:HK97 family phage portal protein